MLKNVKSPEILKSRKKYVWKKSKIWEKIKIYAIFAFLSNLNFTVVAFIPYLAHKSAVFEIIMQFKNYKCLCFLQSELKIYAKLKRKLKADISYATWSPYALSFAIWEVEKIGVKNTSFVLTNIKYIIWSEISII